MVSVSVLVVVVGKYVILVLVLLGWVGDVLILDYSIGGIDCVVCYGGIGNFDGVG